MSYFDAGNNLIESFYSHLRLIGNYIGRRRGGPWPTRHWSCWPTFNTLGMHFIYTVSNLTSAGKSVDPKIWFTAPSGYDKKLFLFACAQNCCYDFYLAMIFRVSRIRTQSHDTWLSPSYLPGTCPAYWRLDIDVHHRHPSYDPHLLRMWWWRRWWKVAPCHYHQATRMIGLTTSLPRYLFFVDFYDTWLCDGRLNHGPVPYRDSILTWLLKYSLVLESSPSPPNLFEYRMTPLFHLHIPENWQCAWKF